MDTLIDNILEEDYRYKLFIYQIVLAYENHLVEDGILTEILGISQFKLGQYVEELIEELNEAQSSSKLSRESAHTLQGERFSIYEYQKLRRFYFEQSLEVNLLIQVAVLQNYTLSEFSEIKFISQSTAYIIVKRLNEYLKNWNVSFKSNTLKGCEADIRFFLFQVFFYYYGSSQVPMFKNKEIEVGQAISDIQLLFSRNFSANQLTQLQLFLNIQTIRILQRNYIENDNFFCMDEKLLNRVIKWYEKKTILLKDEFASETGYLLSFLVLNNFIENDNLIDIKETEVYEVFKTVVSIKLPQLEHLLRGDVEKSLKLICFKWKYFTFSFASFFSKDQITYFQESFPRIHELIYTFVERIDSNKTNDLNEFEKAHFYYDFMFCLLQFESIRALENAVHVFIDFAGGITYNKFIEINILSFNYLNIKIDTKLTKETDIYISDFFNEKVNCEQIIWKNPPLDYDWKVFASKVIELKGG